MKTESTLTKSQRKTYGPKLYTESGQRYRITATVCYDDQCGNGHNSFDITADIDRQSESGRWQKDSGGCCHDEVAKHFPELAPFLKWHLTSSDGPMHYIANTVYHASQHEEKSAWVYFDDPAHGITKQCVKYCSVNEATEMCLNNGFNYVSGVGYRMEKDPKTAKESNLEFARSTAVWPDATDEELTAPGLEDRLKARLPALIEAFRADVEKLGFVF